MFRSSWRPGAQDREPLHHLYGLFYRFSLGEGCKRSQRLQLDLACGPRCICCKHTGSGCVSRTPYMDRPPVWRVTLLCGGLRRRLPRDEFPALRRFCPRVEEHESDREICTSVGPFRGDWPWPLKSTGPAMPCAANITWSHVTCQGAAISWASRCLRRWADCRALRSGSQSRCCWRSL
jgi:hypothetical protein